MAFITEDRVMETTITTGTSDITLAGAVSGYRAFSAVCSNGDLVEYVIDGGTEWESGIGTYPSANTLTRTTVFESSNAGAAVNFSAGSKYVFSARPARFSQPYLIGTVATTSGTSVSFTSIPIYYKSLLFEILGPSHDDGSNRAFRVEFSGDNGSNYTTAQTLVSGLAAATTLYGNLAMHGYRLGAGCIIGSISSLTSDVTAGTNNVAVNWRLAAGVNAVRFSFAAGNLDNGAINLWGLG